MGSIMCFKYYYLFVILSSQLCGRQFVKLAMATDPNATDADLFDPNGFNPSAPIDEGKVPIFPYTDAVDNIDQNSNYPLELIDSLQSSESSPMPTSWTTRTIATNSSTLIDDDEQMSETDTDPSAKLLSVNVQCSFNSMRTSLQFDSPFQGVIYSKDHFHQTECHYVPFHSDRTQFQFDIRLDHCGARLMNDESISEDPMLEETVIVQNEEGIQGMKDTAQHIRCKSADVTNTIINTGLQVDMNDPVDVTYTEDKISAFMDIQLGRGPHAAPVTGIVKIGATLTLVITAVAGGDFDMQVKECLAHNGQSKQNVTQLSSKSKNTMDLIRMSDDDGCIVKPKLMSAWRKTSEKRGRSGVKMVAYSYLQAFKFPDQMDVSLECNIEICKKRCQDNCVKTRQRRETDDVLEQVRLHRTLKVVSNEDIRSIHNVSDHDVAADDRKMQKSDVCFSLWQFIIAIVVVFVLLIASCMTTAIVTLRKNVKGQLATAMLMDRLAFIENMSLRKN